MDLLNNLALGFGVAFTLTNLLYAFGGALLGTLIGVLPGLGPVATIALASLFLGETVSGWQVAGTVLVLAGVYILSRQPIDSSQPTAAASLRPAGKEAS